MEAPTKLFNRNYLTLYLGQSISRLGNQVYSIAMLLWIKEATGSATLMGLLLMISSFPTLVLGPIGGTFADRFSRKSIIIIGDVIRGLAVLGVAMLIFFRPEATQALLVLIFFASTVLAVVTAFFRPAIAAIVPDLVPPDKVVSANSLGQLSVQLAVFIGQGMGGVIFRLLGAPVLFLFNALSFFFASITDSFVKIPKLAPQSQTDWREQMSAFKEDLVDGIRYVFRRGGLRELVLISAVHNFFSIPAVILLPFFVEDYLQVRIDWYGFLITAFGVGGLLGYLFAGISRLPGKPRSRLMVTFMIGVSIAYGVLGLVTSPYAALAVALAAGFMGGYITVNITTIVQLSTPREKRGRVFGVLGTISGSLTPIAMGLSGIVFDLLDQNITLIYVSSGVIMLLLSALISLIPNVRELLAYTPDEEPPTPPAPPSTESRMTGGLPY
jgi:MFS family permease